VKGKHGGVDESTETKYAWKDIEKAQKPSFLVA
jgi:hypothetical protein